MKKVLGTMFFCLFLSNNIFADDYRPKDLEVIEFKDPTTFGLKSGDKAHPINREKATVYCGSKKKFAYQFDSTINILEGTNAGKRTKNHRYFCSRENLKIHPILGTGGWYQAWGIGGKPKFNSGSPKRLFSNYSIAQKNTWDNEDNKSSGAQAFTGESKSNIKKQCKDFGFKEGTEKFADCQLKLFMMMNNNSKMNSSSNQTQTIITAEPKRKIDPSVWDDLLNISKGMSEGKSFTESLGSTGSSSSSSSSKIQCFKTGERISGTNKICSYNCMGSEVVQNIPSTSICALSINLN